MHIRRITRVYPWANREIKYNSLSYTYTFTSVKMGLGYWKTDNIYLLVSQFVNVIQIWFWCINIYFGGQSIQWELFKIIYMTVILKSKMAVLDLLILFIFFEKYQWTVFNCEVEMYWIQSLLKSSEENYVVGKYNVLSINHISSDLEGHQVQISLFQIWYTFIRFSILF